MVPASEIAPALQANLDCDVDAIPCQVSSSADSASALVRYPSEPGTALKVRCWISIEGTGGGWIEKLKWQNGYLLRSRLLVCPRCRATWATVLVEGDLDAFPVTAGCYPCNWSNELFNVPGSILWSTETNELTDWTLLEALPEALVKRELELHLKVFSNV
jgi:hypothetical protein